ncbi:sulfotransferase domain-containing protein [Pelagibacterium montanilacus]|uniref:sulfotransferase domain-containing protein n=1 Tax=Pelagibacterium montanilacus TaxID=2185280 RepID=UPI0013E08678|nr:sulfotransferase domain-containing protein [Pelagibacterium montanilacus]
MSDAQPKPIRPLYFVASYPRSGSNWVRSVIYLLAVLAQPGAPKKIDLRNIDNVIPWDIHHTLYNKATGRDPEKMGEVEIAAARAEVHHLLATDFPGLPVVRTHALRGTFHGHPTINSKVTRGAVYIVRNPLDVAAELTVETGAKPLQIIQAMMTRNRRIKPAERTVIEPQGSWTQNVASWTLSKQKEILVLKYEDIVKNPRHQFRKLADHMRLPATDDAIKTASEMVQAQRKGEGRPGRDLDYRKTLQPIHARAVIEGHAIEMDRHGYLTDRALEYAGLDRATALRIAERYTPLRVGDVPAQSN